MRLAAVALVVAACGSAASLPSLPWVSGLDVTASGEIETRASAERLGAIIGNSEDLGFGAIAVPTNSGTILASYTQGIAVVDANDHLIARAPAFAFVGSADGILAVASGSAGLGQPVIVVAVNRGGHRTSTTTIIVLSIADGGTLAPLFEGAVEEHDGDETTTGAIQFAVQGLFYRPPHRSAEYWSFDRARHAYIRSAAGPQ